MNQTRSVSNLIGFHLLFLCCFPSLTGACNPTDGDSLLFFSVKLSSASPPLNWSSVSKDCCFWEGVRCNNNNQVTHLSLPQRGLSGNISPFLGNLTHLSHLNLSGNRLTGPLPSELFLLSLLEALDLSNNLLKDSLPPFLPFKFMKTLDLSSNYFHGEVPSLFFRLTESLTSCNISNNTFTGPLHPSICNASRFVQLLDLSHNDFNGELPIGFGNCFELQVFRAGFNSLSRPIPGDIFNARKLEEISLPVNYISGKISRDVTQLDNLKVLELWGNELEGLIPDNLGRLSKLETLLLHNNNLTGPIPRSLMNCTNLVALNLRFNQLEGNLSEFNFSAMTHLRSLDLGNNFFTGIIPPSLYLCKSLAAIRLSGNKLEGQISPDIASLKSLTFLSVAYNKLTNVTGAMKLLAACKSLQTLLLSGNFLYEKLPNDENFIQSDQFQNLESLGFWGCYLKGQLPVWLAKLKKLKFLEMSSNQLTGSIPDWLGSLPSLFYINLSENFLSGELTKELCKLPAIESGETSMEAMELPVFLVPNISLTSVLQYNSLSSIPPLINLARNNLTGSIPLEIGQLKFLHILDLSHNNFSGKIPDQMSLLTNLETLDLSGNNLSGEIPPSLGRLNFLSQFSVANNSLKGPIPTGGQFDTFQSADFAGNPGLCGSAIQRSCSDQEPRVIETKTETESSDRELVFGLVAGVTLGFLIGSAFGWWSQIFHKPKLPER